MTHLAYQPRGESVELEADYVVVGSGAGGATAAAALARGGKRVAIVEAGPWRDPGDYPSSVYGAMRDMLDSWGSTFTRGRAAWPIVQGTLVGGSTVINSAIYVPTPGDVIERWEREHGFTDGEALLAAGDQVAREIGTELVPEPSRGRNNVYFGRGADGIAIDNHVIRRYTRGCDGDGQCFQGCRGGRKRSLNEVYVPQVLERGGTVVSCAPVERVLLEGRRAVGVRGRFRHPQTRARGGDFVVRAREGVMLAASVTYSAPLLMRSGLRLPALGTEFRAHPGTPMLGVYDDPIDMGRGATQGWASTHFRDNPGFKLETLALPLDMLAGRLPGAGAQLMERLREYRHMAMWVQGIRAESVGRVRPALGGRSAIHYSFHRQDMERLVAGMRILADMHFAAGARAVLPCIHGMPYALGPDEVHRLDDAPSDPRAYVAILSHLFGGCVMGRDAGSSVCDGEGRVHDHEALFVTDASVIPTNLGVNPQQTIMALARLIAERALERGALPRTSTMRKSRDAAARSATA